jgi:tetratricopeptide (TPR) repeat protein
MDPLLKALMRSPFPACLLPSLCAGIAAICTATAVLAASAPDDVLARARDLIDARHADAAYRLLAPLEAELGGSEDFDYLLGVAALDSGHAGEAVFCLERVLAVDPAFLGARMDLGRAQFESGDAPGARAQFQYLIAQSPPPATRNVIDQYLAALDRRTAGSRHEWRGFLDVGAGYDSNANGATGAGEFLGFTLDPRNVETGSSFLELAAGFNHSAGFANGSAFVASGRLGHRLNPDASFIDLTTASLAGQLQWSWGGTRLDAGVATDFDWLNGESHQRSVALDLGLDRPFAGDWRASIDARLASLRFQPTALEVMDADRWLAALSVSRVAIGSHQGRVGAALLAGGDDTRRTGSPYGNGRVGARLYSSWSMSRSASLYAELAYLDTNYRDSPGFFGVDRTDRQWSALVATEYQNWPGTGWSLAPRIRYVKNDSNVALYEFDRVEAGIFLRRSFR